MAAAGSLVVGVVIGVALLALAFSTFGMGSSLVLDGATLPTGEGVEGDAARATGEEGLSGEVMPAGDGASDGGGGLDLSVLGELTAPSSCASLAPVSTARNAFGARACWHVAGMLPDVASSILEDYEGGGFALHYAGYLDLFQRVWGCVITSSDGWSEVVLVDERTGYEQGECAVTVVRIGESAIEEAEADVSAEG